ncbi:MAG: hypothetical protein IK137_00730 [Bacilli bacterium]|nr:hypothetical protein [Bacilli bacterium]
MTEKQKQLLAVPAALLLTFASGTLVGKYFFGDNSNTETTTTIDDSTDETIKNIDANSVKVFNEGEHLISFRVSYEAKKDNIEGFALNYIPEGYEVFEVTPYTIPNANGFAYGAKTGGYDIWYKNTEPVEVKASYNETLKQYGYYTFGKVIEKEKVLEK